MPNRRNLCLSVALIFLISSNVQAIPLTDKICTYLMNAWNGDRKPTSIFNVQECPYGNPKRNPPNFDLSKGPRSTCHEFAAGAADWLMENGSKKAWLLETFMEADKGFWGKDSADLGHTLTLFLTSFDPKRDRWKAQILDPQTKWLSAEFYFSAPESKPNKDDIPYLVRLQLQDLLISKHYHASPKGKLLIVQINQKAKFRYHTKRQDSPERVGIVVPPLLPIEKEVAEGMQLQGSGADMRPQTNFYYPHGNIDPKLLFDQEPLPNS